MLELRFLGAPQIFLHGQVVTINRQHSMALLAYISLESGSHSREALSALLWAEADLLSSQQNLRTVLKTLRDAIGDALKANRTEVQLLGLIKSDVQQMLLPPEKMGLEALLELRSLWRGEFLQGLRLPNAPDFEIWLEAMRERSKAAFDAILAALVVVLQNQNDLTQALMMARQRIQLDAYSEIAWRDVITLEMRLGRQAAALEAYRTLERNVQEFGGLVSADIQALLIQTAVTQAQISRDDFVARASELIFLQRILTAGQRAFVVGVPGIGKSRLLRQVASQAVWLEGRPSDASVPFATLIRAFGRLWRENASTMPVWMRSALAKLLPEFGESTVGRSQVFAALQQTIVQLPETILVADDLQFFDPSSLEFLWFLLEQHDMPVLVSYRSHELSENTEQMVLNYISAGHAELLELEPLSPSDLQLWLQASGLDQSQVEQLEQATGGNPLFVSETLRAWQEGKTSTPKLEAVLRSRLQGLSANALRLAQVMALLGTDFTLEVAAQMLVVPVLDLLEIHGELVSSGVIRGLVFSHDLFFERVLKSIPEVVKPVLYSAALRVLESGQASASALMRYAVGSDNQLELIRIGILACNEAIRVFAAQVAITWIELVRQALFSLNSTQRNGVDQNDLQPLYLATEVAFLMLKSPNKISHFYEGDAETFGIWGWYKLQAFLLSKSVSYRLDLTQNLERILHIAERAKRAARASQDLQILILINTMECNLEFVQGAADGGLATARRGVEMVRGSSQKSILQTAFNAALDTAQRCGAWQEATLYAQEMAMVYPEEQHPSSYMHAILMLEHCKLFLGQINLERCQENQIQAVKRSFREVFATRIAYLAHFEKGKLALAWQYALTALELAKTGERPMDLIGAYSGYGDILMTLGQFDLALIAYQEALLLIEPLAKTNAQLAGMKVRTLSRFMGLYYRMGDQKSAWAYALKTVQARLIHGQMGLLAWSERHLEQQLLLEQNQNDLADQDFALLETHDPNNPRFQILVQRARASRLAFAQRTKAATKEYKAALATAELLQLPLLQLELLQDLVCLENDSGQFRKKIANLEQQLPTGLASGQQQGFLLVSRNYSVARVHANTVDSKV